MKTIKNDKWRIQLRTKRARTLRALEDAWLDALHGNGYTRPLDANAVSAYWADYATHGSAVRDAFLCYVLSCGNMSGDMMLYLMADPTDARSVDLAYETVGGVWADPDRDPRRHRWDDKVKLALDAFGRILDGAPDDGARAGTLAAIAYLYVLRGDTADARRYVGDALRLDPGNGLAGTLDRALFFGVRPAWAAPVGVSD